MLVLSMLTKRCHQLRQVQQRSSIFKRNSQLKPYQQISFHQQNANEFSELYKSLKTDIYSKELSQNGVSRGDVFANNDLDLRNVSSIGFNYDYTLALYSEELHGTLYKMAADKLVEEFHYPSDISHYKYDATFPIRGLHFDMKNGYLMKISSTNRVQLGAVYRGYRKIADEEVLNEYGGTMINIDLISMDARNRAARIFQRMDLFSMAFLSLLTNVIEYFMGKRIDFNPSYIYYDVEKAINEVHTSGDMHQAIINDLDRYLPKKKGLETYLNRLLSNKKRLFLMTNSPFSFVDKGMTHLFHSDWRDIFEIVIVDARKPTFFTCGESRPFRNINLKNGTYLWDHVKDFQRYGVYGEGNIKSFTKFGGYEGSGVIYFGDHVHSDLMDPVERIGWRTGAVIPELACEINIGNSEGYIRDIDWLVTLEHLISVLQVNKGLDTSALLNEWRVERKSLRRKSKNLFNPYFGSMFRTHQNPTSFSLRITQYADLYMSSIENLLNYSDDFHFLPSRNLLPHERI